MLQVKLLEMPLTELEESINAELDDNPALESENPDDMLSESYDGDSPLEHDADSSNSDSDTDSDDAYEAQSEKEEKKTSSTRHWKASDRMTRCPITAPTNTATRTQPNTKKWYMETPRPSTTS